MARRALDPARDERLEQEPVPRVVRWNLMLVWFMRVVALLWIAKGLVAWATIVGVVEVGTPFEIRSRGYQATVVYFAVIDLVAAVGLWLTSTWGGVLWLLAVMSHLILSVFFPRIIASDLATVSLFIVLIAAYLATSWLAASEE